MKNWFIRKCYQWAWIRHSAETLGRRADVENILLDVAAGKLPVPSRAEFRTLALYLGTRGSKKPVIKG